MTHLPPSSNFSATLADPSHTVGLCHSSGGHCRADTPRARPRGEVLDLDPRTLLEAEAPCKALSAELAERGVLAFKGRLGEGLGRGDGSGCPMVTAGLCCQGEFPFDGVMLGEIRGGALDRERWVACSLLF